MSSENVLANPIVANAFTARIYGTAVYTCVIWDWLTTLRMEYKRIWMSDWTVVKTLFVWLRYFTLFGYPVALAALDGDWSTRTCQTLKNFELVVSMLIMLPAEALLMMRCWAIWQKNMIILLVGFVGLTLIAVGQILTTVHSVPLPIPPPLDKFACIAAQANGNSRAANARSYGFLLGNPMPFDLVLTSLTLYKALQHRRSGVGSDVLSIFVKDGCLYFLCITAVNVVNLVFLLQPDQSIAPVNVQMVVLSSSMFAQRMVLHLRQGREYGGSSSTGSRRRGTSARPRGTRSQTAPCDDVPSPLRAIFGSPETEKHGGVGDSKELALQLANATGPPLAKFEQDWPSSDTPSGYALKSPDATSPTPNILWRVDSPPELASVHLAHGGQPYTSPGYARRTLPAIPVSVGYAAPTGYEFGTEHV